MRFTTILSLALAALTVEASPVVLEERDVADPKITSPDASTVWTVGKTETVTWDTSNLPASITNPQGTILLGFLNDTSGNEHLNVDSPLASGFDITAGHVDIIVPNVADGSDYIIALLGDSGNISPMFTITGGSASSGAATTTTGTNVGIASGSSSTATTTDSTVSASSPSAATPVASTATTSAPLLTPTAPTVASTLPSGSASNSGSHSGSGTSSAAPTTTTTTTSGAMSRFGSGSHAALFAQVGGALLAVCLFA